MAAKLVKCPESFVPLLERAEEIMGGFFQDLQREPEKGQIHIQGVRYMLMRTDSMSIELQEELRKSFGEAGARQIRYKLGKACGLQDAKLFAELLQVEDPALRIALGPVHFAHVGWASEEFLEGVPEMSENYFAAYDHPYSFEAAAYIDRGLVSKHPVCHMTAGYGCGWCQATFGVDLTVEELTCRAKGDQQCLFALAPTQSFARLVADFKQRRGL